jgi:hypothetical protein
MKNNLLLILLVFSTGVFSRNKIIQDSISKINSDSLSFPSKSKIGSSHNKIDNNTELSQTTIKPTDQTENVSAQERYRRLVQRGKFYDQNQASILSQSIRPMQAYGNYEFDPVSTNFYRFKNSPCFEKLGFNAVRAMNDSLNFELEYQSCEISYKNDQSKKRFLIGLLLTPFFGMLLFLYKRNNIKINTKK